MGNNTERLHGQGGVVTGKREIESKEGPNDEINEQNKPKYTRQLQSTSSYPEQMNNWFNTL